MNKILLTVALAALLFAACEKTAEKADNKPSNSSQPIHSLQDANGRVLGMVDYLGMGQPPEGDTAHLDFFQKATGFRPSKMVLFPSTNEALAALASSRVDIVNSMTEPTANYYAQQNPNFKMIPTPMAPKVSHAMAVRAPDTALLASINAAIQTLKENGTMAQLAERYLKGDSNVALTGTVDEISVKPDAKTLVMAVNGDHPPFDYVATNGKPDGYNVALTEAVAKLMGANIKFVQVNVGAYQSALQSGRVDILFLFAPNLQKAIKDIAASDVYAVDLPSAILVRK
jgi:ABC-type amino acid transport substrate-binding protein